MSSDQIPIYSLLETHEDTVTYRVPDPSGETSAWVRIGLFPWELEGVSLGKALTAELTDEEIDLVVEQADGVGLRVKFHPPTPYPRPKGFGDRVRETFETFSSGFDNGGRTFRIQDADPNELRQTARWIALYGFAFWWWLECHSDYPLGKRGTRAEMQVPELDDVLEDGTVIAPDGSTHESPYDLGDIDLLAPDEWQSPYERAREYIQKAVDELGDVPPLTVRSALQDAAESVETPTPEKTEARKERDRFKAVFRDVEGIGHRLRGQLWREFESVDALCDDLRTGCDRLRSLSGIGESRIDAVTDALVEAGELDRSEVSR